MIALRYIATLALIAVAALKIRSRSTKVHKPTASGAIRKHDTHGDGYFGASRSGGKVHQGLDYIVRPGENIYSPIHGTITRHAYPYSNDNRYKGIEIKGTGPHVGWLIKIFYMVPISVGQDVKPGGFIGTAQDIASKYPGITPHIHLELYIGGTAVDPSIHI